MERYSSNATLFFVIFLPVFIWVFLLLATMGVFLGPVMDESVYFSLTTKIIVVCLLVVVSILFSLYAFKLKRLEADSEKLYISNYFKHTMMPIENIRNVIITDIILMRIVTIRFTQKSIWGNTIKILEREDMFQKYCEAHGIPLLK
ncbi:MAG: hypothetical protein KDC25_06010 [Saprospiraceae bacterium]|jgi:F0F1-type ATP synthase membrane subunit a|nr:hypothetical protein [Saprospiraceae bacterium]